MRPAIISPRFGAIQQKPQGTLKPAAACHRLPYIHRAQLLKELLVVQEVQELGGAGSQEMAAWGEWCSKGSYRFRFDTCYEIGATS